MSELDPVPVGQYDSEPAPGATAGSLLRQAREAAGIHIAALAVSLKVPVKKLEALEQDRFDLLPDAVFVRALASSMALAADRRGDIFAAQGKKAEAKAEYEKAYKELDERAEYRRLVEVKLNALGVDPAAQAKSATEASNSEVKK